MSVEPEWFYSSLAQVVAALSGFIGGFLLLRLLDTMREWNGLKERLRQLQIAWNRAHHKNESYREQDERHFGPFTGERLEASQAETAAWGDLYQAIQDSRAAMMPGELTLAIVGVAFLALGGTLGPLFFLPAPAVGDKVPWLLAVGVVFAGLLGVVYRGARRALKDLKEFEKSELYSLTEWRLEDYELQIEGWRDRDEQERLEKEKQLEEGGSDDTED